MYLGGFFSISEYNLMQILDVVNLNHIYGWVQIENDAGFSSLMLD